MRSYPRPKEQYLFVEKKPADGVCGQCGSEDIKKYPVVSEGGWWMVTKCQQCFSVMDKKHLDSRLGSLEILSDLL